MRGESEADSTHTSTIWLEVQMHYLYSVSIQHETFLNKFYRGKTNEKRWQDASILFHNQLFYGFLAIIARSSIEQKTSKTFLKKLRKL